MLLVQNFFAVGASGPSGTTGATGATGPDAICRRLMRMEDDTNENSDISDGNNISNLRASGEGEGESIDPTLQLKQMVVDLQMEIDELKRRLGVGEEGHRRVLC